MSIYKGNIPNLIALAAGPSALGQSGVMLTIEYETAFELYNNRPYHNYESQGHGYIVRGPAGEARAEELEDALKQYIAKTDRAFALKEQA